MILEALLYVAAVCSGDKDCYIIANPARPNTYVLTICEQIEEPYTVDFFTSGGDNIHVKTLHRPKQLCNFEDFPRDGLYEQNLRWRDEDSKSETD